jgi:flagellin
MGFSINTNLDALNTYQNLTKVQNSLSSSLAKLSSGLRINNAGDDAAGLTIATDLGAQVSGLTQASRNAQDGTSVVQTADGALSQVQSLLGNLRDLAVQAANDSNSDSARQAITTQASAITAEISRLGSSVNFNGRNLLDGSLTQMNFQVGADGNSASQINVNLSTANLLTVANSLSNGSTGAKLTAAQAATIGVAKDVNTNGTTTSVTLATATTTALSATGATVDQQVSALNADSAFAGAFKATKVTTSGVDYVQITANDGGTATAATAAAPGTAVGSVASGAGSINFTSATTAQASIASIQTQLDNVSAARAQIGAAENRFTSAESTIATSITNLTAAKSRITDVDMASEMVSYSRANILSQSGTAMLAQANSLPQLALKLLG